MTLRCWCACSFALACRWGGPEGDPSALTDAPPPSATRATTEEDDGADPAASPEPADATAGLQPAAPSDVDSSAIDEDGVPDGIQAGISSADAGTLPAPKPAQSCTAPPGLLCDPVANTGCLPLMQCITEPNGAAAQCVFSGVPLGATCTQDALSTTCPPGRACVAGECREYCYCDADCEGGGECAGSSPDVVRLCTP